MGWLITILAIAALFSFPAYAYDNSPLQDICVAVNDTNASVFVNGKFCKDPKLATADDFFSAANADIVVDATTMPGLNTLGISAVRGALGPHAVFPLHTHPRATEIITLLKGPPVLVGFLVPNKNFFTSRLFAKILKPGDVFVFPIGLLHFQYNLGNTTATFFISFNSQDPGFVIVPDSIFASTPSLPLDFLSKNFKLDNATIAALIKSFT